ncbi:MAG: hypothetical protein V1897_00895 [Pseudomonadota bacterium]
MSENHKRAISVTLALLDEAFSEFDRWARGDEIKSVLYEVENTLSTDQRHRLSVELAEVRKTLLDIRDHLGLNRTSNSAKKMILAQCSILWTTLVELESRYLKSYGELPPGLGTYLDPRAILLIQGLRRISDIVGKD